MDTRHRIIFSGKIKEGFDPVLVKKLAAFKLKATPEQISRLFSGRRAIIKKNLGLQRAERYASDLAKLGMIVVIQVEAAVAGPCTSRPEATDDVVRHALPEDAPAPFFDSLSTQLNLNTLNRSRFSASQ